MAKEDPTVRKRLSADAALKRNQQIITLFLAKESVRDIAVATGASRMSVHRVIKAYQAALDRPAADDPDFDEDEDAELGALAAKLTPQLSCEDVQTGEQWDALNDLEKFRWAHLPADHPARAV
ncbi:hypothetical protein MMAN_06480 [Mycobacterium mantenii]|uniref:Uncharacterized protein n=1 Tax=Mycobacterium mantenii TaxID=560555 RepID=A0A1X0FXW5_MYCNT|nr:helix-turn-helix domain-containing protein [Mycobacterium mantenii]MCV7242808.1 helix-turn-helix domain-containing protein [Mycobacterium mantenii]ORB06359.1 hypothetical protein BST30_10320 [Mycobacterium mantenii]BBY36514.1 hypothetical protein MMAN_06480 [Mycobacterium mantenii]